VLTIKDTLKETKGEWQLRCLYGLLGSTEWQLKILSDTQFITDLLAIPEPQNYVWDLLVSIAQHPGTISSFLISCNLILELF
jgi:hypothetical protein